MKFPRAARIEKGRSLLDPDQDAPQRKRAADGCSSVGNRQDFQVPQIREGLVAILAAHLQRGFQPGAYGWPSRISVKSAAEIVGEMQAARAGRLAIGHSGYG